MKLKKFISFAAVFLLTTSGAFAHAASADGKIIQDVSQIDQNEINAANLAMDKAQNQQVKDFAIWMNEAHSKHLKEMQDLSQKIDVAAAKSSTAALLEKKGKTEVAQLSKLNSNAFDKAYMKAMIKDHSEALKLLKKEQSKAANSELKTKLEVTQTHVKEHLNKAEEIKKALG